MAMHFFKCLFVLFRYSRWFNENLLCASLWQYYSEYSLGGYEHLFIFFVAFSFAKLKRQFDVNISSTFRCKHIVSTQRNGFSSFPHWLYCFYYDYCLAVEETLARAYLLSFVCQVREAITVNSHYNDSRVRCANAPIQLIHMQIAILFYFLIRFLIASFPSQFALPFSGCRCCWCCIHFTYPALFLIIFCLCRAAPCTRLLFCIYFANISKTTFWCFAWIISNVRWNKRSAQ